MRAPRPALELAIVRYCTATVLADWERLDEAERLVALCEGDFVAFRDQTRWIHSRLLRGVIRFRRGDYSEAIVVWNELLHRVDSASDELLAASLHANIGIAERHTGNLQAATERTLFALGAFERRSSNSSRSCLGNKAHPDEPQGEVPLQAECRSVRQLGQPTAVELRSAQ